MPIQKRNEKCYASRYRSETTAVFLVFKLIDRIVKLPVLFKKTLEVLSVLIFIGTSGAGTNDIAKWANGFMMPVVATPEEVDENHSVADKNTKLVTISDWIDVDDYGVLRFLFPLDTHVSPGDVLMCICINFSWLACLILIALSTPVVVRDIKKIILRT